MKPSLRFTSLLFFSFFVVALTSEIRAQVKWDFDENGGTASPVSTSVPSNMTASDFSFGNPFGTVSPMVTNSSPSPVGTNSNYTITGSGNYNATVAVVAGAFSGATSTYFTVTLTPAAGYSINISAIQFGTRALSNTGPNAFQIYTSVDNFTTSLAGNSISSNATWYSKQPTITAVTGAVGTPVVVRVYGYSAVAPVSGTANWRVDDLGITASAVNTLPVVLGLFNATVENSQTQLQWQTTEEVNTAYYAVEKSVDAEHFTEAGRVSSLNNVTGGTYHYTDANTSPLSATYYRLKMVDKDGSYQYSRALLVTARQNVALHVYPNPAISTVVVEHPVALAHTVLKLVTMDGKTVISQPVAIGTVETIVPVQSLVKGNYLLVWENEQVRSASMLLKQ